MTTVFRPLLIVIMGFVPMIMVVFLTMSLGSALSSDLSIDELGDQVLPILNPLYALAIGITYWPFHILLVCILLYLFSFLWIARGKGQHKRKRFQQALLFSFKLIVILVAIFSFLYWFFIGEGPINTFIWNQICFTLGMIIFMLMAVPILIRVL